MYAPTVWAIDRPRSRAARPSAGSSLGASRMVARTRGYSASTYAAQESHMNPTHDLLKILFVELCQTEESAIEHPRTEAERLAATPPAAALLAVSAHAERLRLELEAIARAEDLGTTTLGAKIGDALSVMRDFVIDRTVSREKSYRGTLIGMHHGVDVVRLVRHTAVAAGACLTTQSLELDGATIAFTPTTFPNFVGSPSSNISIHDMDSSAAIVFPVYAAGTITATNNKFASLALPVWSPANDSTFQDNAIDNVTFGLSSFQHRISLLDNLGTTFAFPNLVLAPQGDLYLQGSQDVAAAGLRTIQRLQYQFTGGTVDVSALEVADTVTVGSVLWTSYSLPLLTTVTGSFGVGDNSILETLSVPNLVSAGSIILLANTTLTRLDLGSLEDVSQDVLMRDNSLCTIQPYMGSISNLQTVTGSFSIEYNTVLTSILAANLATIGGDFLVDYNDILSCSVVTAITTNSGFSVGCDIYTTDNAGNGGSNCP